MPLLRPALLLVVVAAASLAAPAAASAFRETTRPASWALVDSGSDARSLVLSYTGGGCAGEATAALSESPTHIAIRLDQRVSEPEEGEACTADLRIYRITVRLAAPVAGRAVRGHARRPHTDFLIPYRIDGDEYVPLVPRVTGLARRDAVRLLRLQRYRMQVRTLRSCSERGHVVRQSLRPRSERRSNTIRIAVRPACRALPPLAGR